MQQFSLPATEPRAHDPWAVALANASLLGIGYLMIGRRRLAAASALITLVLITVLASVARSVWMEIVVALWWATVIGHGWALAARAPRSRMWRHRALAFAVTLAVLAAVTLLRVDADAIGHRVDLARDAGSCMRADAAASRVWFGDRVADAPRTASIDRTVHACELTRSATAQLDTALGGDIGSLAAAFTTLHTVLTRFPGHEEAVRLTLDPFLAKLPANDPCHTVTLTDWLTRRPADGTLLDHASTVAARLALTAFHACQLATLRTLLQTPYPGEQPDYCSRPQPYGAAKAYGRPGPDAALIFGNDSDTGQFPAEWRAHDASDAVLILCAGPTRFGDVVQTCPYHSETTQWDGEVTFQKHAIPLRAYEVRTARIVFDGQIQIDGASCPQHLSYTYHGIDVPPSHVYVTSADSDVRAAFNSLINP